MKHKFGWQSDGTKALKSTFKTASGLCQQTQCHTLWMLSICIQCISLKLSWTPRQIHFSLVKITIQTAYKHSNKATSYVSDFIHPIHRTHAVVSEYSRFFLFLWKFISKVADSFLFHIYFTLQKRKKKVNHSKMVIF